MTITDFFIICSGANRDILSRCPGERAKYAGIGATILFTGLFAFISSAYALFTVFDSIVWSVAVALLWGLMIFNLDRFIVSSMRKENTFRAELIPALPRLVLAVVISVVIARPLELKIFEKELEPQLVIMEQEAFAAEEREVRARYAAERMRLDSALHRLEQRIDTLRLRRDRLALRAQEEADGTGGTRRRNAGPIYQLKRADALRAEEELRAAESEQRGAVSALRRATTVNDSLMRSAVGALAYTPRDGMAARMEAMAALTDTSPPVWWAHWFIMFLFVAVECAPVLVKLLSPRGPYDNLLREEEFLFASREVAAVARSSDEARREIAALSEAERTAGGRRLDENLKRL